MLIKAKIKYSTINGKGEKHDITATISGRTQEELDGRIAKFIERLYHRAEWSGLTVKMR